MKRRLLILCAVCASLAGVASGQSRRVTLDLEAVTAPRAVAALSRFSDRTLVLRADPAPGRTASFKWANTPFSQALRQVCERFELKVIRGSTYDLVPDIVLRPESRERLGEITKDGYRIYVSSRAIRPEGPVAAREDRLSLTLDVDLGDHDWRTLDSIHPVRAQDDLGNMLTRSAPSGLPQRFHLDEWATAFSLGPLHPKARRLVWIEGALNGRKLHRQVEITVPLPKPGSTTRAGVNGNTVVVEIEAREPVTQVKGRMTIVPGPGLELDADSIHPPRLVGVSGKLYGSKRGSGRHKKDASGHQIEVVGDYDSIPEPVKGALFAWSERSPIQRLLSFRLTDIPLPPRQSEMVPAPAKP